MKELGQVGSILHKTQLMIVNGFHGNAELSYLYSTSKAASFFHKSKCKKEIFFATVSAIKIVNASDTFRSY